MQAVLFTKLFFKKSSGEIADAAANVGFSAIDLLIRPGWVDPGDLAGIRRAFDTLRRAGLTVPMITTDVTDPASSPELEPILDLCAENGAQLARLGYWKYDAERGYRSCFSDARRDLESLEKLAQRSGVRLAVQLHGGTIHASGSLTAALLDGHDPALIGAYPDPGNQAVQDGREDWRMTFDLLRPWLCCVGVKNGGWSPAETTADGQRRWQSDWLPIADGMVPWSDILTDLRARDYPGLLSFHSHYEVPLARALDLTRADLSFVQHQLNS